MSTKGMDSEEGGPGLERAGTGRPVDCSAALGWQPAPLARQLDSAGCAKRRPSGQGWQLGCSPLATPVST